MNLTLYADFNCPDCYLAARRADILSDAGVPVDVRAFEQRPGLPVFGRRLGRGDQLALEIEFRVLTELLLPGERLPWAMPRATPKSEAAVSAYAEFYPSPLAEDVRRLLFESYWCEGTDIGNPELLRERLAGPIRRSGAALQPPDSGYPVGANRAPVTIGAYRRIESWRVEWQRLGRRPLPVLLVDGATLSGVDAIRRLGKEITRFGVDLAPGLAEPRRSSPDRRHRSPTREAPAQSRRRHGHPVSLMTNRPT